MLVLHRIRTDKESVISLLYKRGLLDATEQVEAVYALDIAKRRVQMQLNNLTSRLNKLNKAIGIQMKENRSIPPFEREEINLLKEKTKCLAQERKAYEAALIEKLYQLPNLPHNSVPDGAHAKENVVIYQTATLPYTDSTALPHWDLVKKYRLVDFELGNKITAAGFPVYIGQGAKLQRALINFFLDKAAANGYVEVQPPILVNASAAYATGQLPDKEGQMYHIPTENLYLIPTAEIPLTNIYRDSIVEERSLPIKQVGYTPCFRREAGSWGTHVRGLNRLHQFDKVELVQICHPDDSYTHLEEMVTYTEELVKQLSLPYRIVKLCTGDLGFCASMTYDIEVYSMVQDKWLEVSSISNFESFQSNRLSLRYRDKKNKKYLVHTLNGSALALPRIIAALLELNQTKKGIVVPEVLHPYTGFDTIC